MLRSNNLKANGLLLLAAVFLRSFFLTTEAAAQGAYTNAGYSEVSR